MDDSEDNDDDNDGALDDEDTADNNENICSDNDGDTCDDCLYGSYNPSNDGTDIDGDGICDIYGGYENGDYDQQPDCFTNDEDECGLCGGSGPVEGEGFACNGTPLEFQFNQSYVQAFYSVISIEDIYGEELEAADWVAAFNDTICVGSRRWDISLCSGGICDVPAMGYHPSTENMAILTYGYLNEGDKPSFRIYDASEGEYFNVSAFEDQIDGFTNNGFFDIDALMITKDYTIDLQQYMNLISFYVLPEDNNVNVVMQDLDNLATISGEGIAAQYIDTGWIGPLTDFDISSGYWLRMEAADTLHGSGFPYNVKRVFNLHAGANLISFPSYGSFHIPDALPDNAEAHINAIIGEGAIAIHQDNGQWVGSLSTFEGLHGYWIFTDAPISFTYDLDELDMFAREEPTSEKPVDLDFIQSSKQAFYFVDESIIQDGNAKPGDWFISFCGTTIAGLRQYLGETIDIPVMGYDGHYSTAGYCESGDTPQFKLFKSETSEMINLYSETPAWEPNGIYFVDNMSETSLIPENFSMLSAYPNPFNPVTSIGFDIPSESMLQIIIFNMKGQQVETLVNEVTSPGRYSINWDAGHIASGVYFVHFIASGNGFAPVSQIQKVMLIK